MKKSLISFILFLLLIILGCNNTLQLEVTGNNSINQSFVQLEEENQAQYSLNEINNALFNNSFNNTFDEHLEEYKKDLFIYQQQNDIISVKNYSLENLVMAKESIFQLKKIIDDIYSNVNFTNSLNLSNYSTWDKWEIIIDERRMMKYHIYFKEQIVIVEILRKDDYMDSYINFNNFPFSYQYFAYNDTPKEYVIKNNAFIYNYTYEPVLQSEILEKISLPESDIIELSKIIKFNKIKAVTPLGDQSKKTYYFEELQDRNYARQNFNLYCAQNIFISVKPNMVHLKIFESGSDDSTTNVMNQFDKNRIETLPKISEILKQCPIKENLEISELTKEIKIVTGKNYYFVKSTNNTYDSNISDQFIKFRITIGNKIDSNKKFLEISKQNYLNYFSFHSIQINEFIKRLIKMKNEGGYYVHYLSHTFIDKSVRLNTTRISQNIILDEDAKIRTYTKKYAKSKRPYYDLYRYEKYGDLVFYDSYKGDLYLFVQRASIKCNHDMIVDMYIDHFDEGITGTTDDLQAFNTKLDDYKNELIDYSKKLELFCKVN